MHHFTIRDIENLSGIKAHTLRMWEQRYGLCTCKRKESLHRYYDNEDLKHILRIAYLYHNGTKISQIARYTTQEIIEYAAKRFDSDEYEVLVNQLIEASMDYNQESFEKILYRTIQSMGIEQTMEKLVYPFMDKIGLLWMTGHIVPAQEHFSSHLIQTAMIAAINALPCPKNADTCIVLFTPLGEDHELPLLFIQYIIKKRGCRTVLLGKNIATEVVIDYCLARPAAKLYFHLITNFTNCQPDQYIAKLCAALPDRKILASGPALKEIRETPPNVQLLRSLQEVKACDYFA